MGKVTIFEGKINGDKFDNVQAYNEKMNELIKAGVKDIQATSSTYIKIVDNDDKDSQCKNTNSTCDVNLNGYDDCDLTFYPFFDDDNIKYLDLLVTNDPQINKEAKEECSLMLEKCYRYIVENLYDSNIDINVKKEYLEDINNIIKTIKTDSQNTDKVLLDIERARKEAFNELKMAQQKYNECIKKYDEDKYILESAKPIISQMLNFYNDVAVESVNAINEAKCEDNCKNCNKETCPKCGKCKCECTCDNNEINCSVREISPQHVSNFSELFDKILEDCGIKYK